MSRFTVFMGCILVVSLLCGCSGGKGSSSPVVATPSITWPAPAAITYGTALSSTQLNAASNSPGTFTYSPAAGTVLAAGTQALSVTFTPSDTTTYKSVTSTVSLTVNPATPTITWNTPVAVTVGTALGSTQLNATASFGGASVPGAFTYSPSAGTLMNTAGTQTLSVTFAPTDTTDFKPAMATVSLTTNGLPQPTVTVTPEETTHPYAENLLVTAAVSGSGGTPTGSVVLSSGGFTSSALTLSSGSATFYVQPGWLAEGSDTLTVTYSPDSGSSSAYAASAGTANINITSPGSTNVTVNINTLANRHQISPYIYGFNSTNETDVTNLSPTFVRMGGNAASNFNWTNSHYNAGGDWFYEDFGFSDGNGNPLNTVGFTNFTVDSGSQQLNTMPMLNWVAQQSAWSFSVKQFGAQCKVNPYNSDAGDGLMTDCSTPVTTQPVTNAYYPLVDTPKDCPSGTTDGTTCVDRQSYAQNLSAAYGNATCNVPYSPITSCHFYDMDNEPEIWNGSHRDVHPSQPGYEELSKRFENEGAALKTWDPNAVRFGPITCCYNFLWMAGSSTDGRSTHAGIDFAPWWLNQINWLDQINGARTLDVFDIHAYFGDNINNSGFTNVQLRSEVAKYVRTYWDPMYYNAGDDADWITTTQPNRGVTFLIPRMKALVNAIYPGTPLSFTEWESFFNEWEFATALSDADAFGVMGREGLSFSSRWGGPSATDTTTNQPHPNYQSFKLWTNYDGARHGFGTLSISDQSSANPDQFVSFAALNSTGTTMTIMVLNKDPNNMANVTFNLNGFNASTYTAYAVGSTNPSAIVPSPSQSWSAMQTFAPYSITLLVVNGTQNSTPASEWYMQPDDLMVPAGGTAQLKPTIYSGSTSVTVTSAVFDAFEGAPACNGSFSITNNPAFITVTAPSTPGFCHYTVTGSDGTASSTQSGWIVVGNPSGTLSTSGSGQTGMRGTTLSVPLTVTLNSGASGLSASGAEIFFTTSAGTLSNGSTSGSKIIANTNASGVASVNLTLPSSPGTITVTAQSQFALGGTSVTFTETAQ